MCMVHIVMTYTIMEYVLMAYIVVDFVGKEASRKGMGCPGNTSVESDGQLKRYTNDYAPA